MTIYQNQLFLVTLLVLPEIKCFMATISFKGWDLEWPLTWAVLNVNLRQFLANDYVFLGVCIFTKSASLLTPAKKNLGATIRIS